MDGIKIIKSKRKSIAIAVRPDGTIEVRAPRYIPGFMINAFIKSKSDWIKERQAHVAKHFVAPKKFENGEKFTYLGNEYSLKLGNYLDIQIKGDSLLFPLALVFRGKESVEKWYIKQAKEIIKSHVDTFSKEMELPYKSISFSDTKSKWGSCTHDNRLQFNWRLIMAPLIVVRYVIIHELVHTIHKNHSASFWRKVSEVNPSYKQQIKWLKAHGDKLHI